MKENNIQIIKITTKIYLQITNYLRSQSVLHTINVFQLYIFIKNLSFGYSYILILT